jgi:hypothetical protein
VYDLSTASKPVLVSLVQTICEHNEDRTPAASTLSRQKAEQLRDFIEAFLSKHADEFFIDESGNLCACEDLSDDEAEADETELDAIKAELDVIEADVNTLEDEMKAIEAEMENADADDDEEGASRAKTADHDDVITVLATSWSGRDGSDSLRRRSLLKSGMTVGEFIELVGSKARRTLRKAVRKGWIEITPAG